MKMGGGKARDTANSGVGQSNGPAANLGWRAFAVAIAAFVVLGAAGGFLTEIGPWYRGLKVPAWKPPDWAFGPIWTTIFVLAAISASRAWTYAQTADLKRWIVVLFLANGFANLLWSLLFFFLKRPDWALAEVGLLWLSIVALIVVTWRASKLASVLLVPYLVWVSIAAYLNYTIVGMNGRFG
jgi:translocator protein